MSIKENIEVINEKISNAALIADKDPKDISLVAVAKNVELHRIFEAINSGVVCIGENRVQEMLEKFEHIKEKVQWHLVGYLQTNKVKYLVDKVALIHSLDRVSLAKEINKRGRTINRIIPALIQVNVSRETTKAGVYEEELLPFIKKIADYPYLGIKGLMTIGPNTDDTKAIRLCFRRLNSLFQSLRSEDIKGINMDYLSMGMTKDYEIAIQEGANMVRIGRAIFEDK